MKKIFTLAAMFAAVALVSCAEQAQKENAEETTAPAVEAVEETAPAAEETAPATEEAAPAAEETAPAEKAE